MMLIVYGSSCAEQSEFERYDSPLELLNIQGKLPQVLQHLLTQGLDFHQKEHLKK